MSTKSKGSKRPLTKGQMTNTKGGSSARKGSTSVDGTASGDSGSGTTSTARGGGKGGGVTYTK